METVSRLHETYDLIRTTRGTRGRAAFDHVTRSAIIFLAAAFEVYIEDVIIECCNQQISFAQDAVNLPHDVKKTINDYVKQEGNGEPPTNLCDEGWRRVYRKIVEQRTGKLNTPKKQQIADLFKSLIGIVESKINAIQNISDLDGIIAFRGEIAHRVRANIYVGIDQLVEKQEKIEKIVKSTDKTILAFFRNTYQGRRLPWNDVY